ncbi:hypothetical protein EDF34_0762 [Cellulomonas sp. PhB150]|nr:hypothetical protein EDF34_0762 [Cellulomonas sp. PhB150]
MDTTVRSATEPSMTLPELAAFLSVSGQSYGLPTAPREAGGADLRWSGALREGGGIDVMQITL